MRLNLTLHIILIKIICKDEQTVKEFFDYMRGDMTGFEYGILSEISDEIAYEYPSFAFIEAYKMLAEKYPEETEKYHKKFAKSKKNY